jgi:hypothetical protein
MMVWAVVIAFIAVAAAIVLAVAGLLQIAELRRRQQKVDALETDVLSLKNDVSVNGRKLDMALEQLTVSRENWDAVVGEQSRKLALLRARTDVRFLTADTDASQASRVAADLEQYAVRTLEHETSSPSRPVILRGGLYARQASVLDVMPGLVDKLLSAVGADIMYRQADGAHGSKFYLRWPARGSAPRLILGSLISAAAADNSTGPDQPRPAEEQAADPQAAAPPVPEPEPEAAEPRAAQPGVAELRTILGALRDGDPAVLHVGPLVVASGETGLSAGFAPADWRGLDDSQKAAVVEGVGPGLLAKIGVHDVIDLSGLQGQRTA